MLVIHFQILGAPQPQQVWEVLSYCIKKTHVLHASAALLDYATEGRERPVTKPATTESHKEMGAPSVTPL